MAQGGELGGPKFVFMRGPGLTWAPLSFVIDAEVKPVIRGVGQKDPDVLLYIQQVSLRSPEQLPVQL